MCGKEYWLYQEHVIPMEALKVVCCDCYNKPYYIKYEMDGNVYGLGSLEPKPFSFKETNLKELK